MLKQKNGMIYYQRIMDLLGVEEFKEMVAGLEVFRENKEQYALGKVTLPNYLWVFNRGGGITTCVESFAKYLYHSKLMDFKGKMKYFEFSPHYPLNDDLKLLSEVISDNSGHHRYYRGIACVIIDNWVGKTGEEEFLKILDYLENMSDKILSIFCVHAPSSNDKTKQDFKKQIGDIESSLSAYLHFETKRFRFPNTQELIEFVEKKYLHINSFKLTIEAHDLLKETINDIVNTDNFNGFITIKQLGNDMLFKILSTQNIVKKTTKPSDKILATIQGIPLLHQINADMLRDFHKNSAYIKSLKKISRPKQTMGFSINREQ